jgi:adenine/guanine phosphoribosyltransferase-like PRPP-binding protein
MEEHSTRSFLSYLQAVRSGTLFVADRHGLENQYWSELERVRTNFAQAVVAQGGSFDLIVDPPSRSGLHRPYLVAMRQLCPTVEHCRFVKRRDVSSGESGTSRDDLAQAIEIRGAGEADALKPSKVLIVDDVFATGRTAAVLIDALTPLVAPGAEYTLACVIRVGGNPQGRRP